MRTLTLVLVTAALAALALAATVPARPASRAAITAIVVPATVTAGERLSVFGSARLPDAGILDRRFRVCEVATGDCRTTGWGTLTGPADWSGFAGSFAPERPGRYVLSWTLYGPWGGDSQRATVRTKAEVMVVAGPP